MNKAEAQGRIAKLRREINHHRYLKHVLDRQEISDAAEDALKHELAKLEETFPEFVNPDSPTQRVAGKALAKFEKVRHRARMTSLNDVFSPEEFREWETRIKKLLPAPSVHPALLEYFAEAKGDGFAVSLIYENGILKTGATRGDGLIGENVTVNLKTVESIPLKIHVEDNEPTGKHKDIRAILESFPRVNRAVRNLPKIIEVRGEAYMAKTAFEALNRGQKKLGLQTFANPRNVAAGSVRQLDPKITASRRLAFFAWDLVTDLGQETHEEKHLIMKVLGFPTIPLTRVCRSTKEVAEFWREVADRREKLPYLIDGIVVQVNDGKLFQRLGVVGKAPRGAVAFKFTAKESTTVVEDIVVQVGRTGVLTPVAVLRPVQIGGVTVSRATLHNLDEIRRLDARIGDTVIVERAGDVIPAVTGVLKRMRPKNAREFNMPKKCPICGSPVIHNEGEVAYRCSNKECSAIQRKKLYHFASKRALDINGLGPKNIDALVENGLIRDAADIFLLKKDEISGLERFGDKSAENLIKAADDKKRVSLDRFIYALGIHNVGEETSIDLAERFGTLEKLKNVSLDELQKVRDIGEVVAKGIREWFSQERNAKLLEKFAKVGVKVESRKIDGRSRKFAGKTFVLTGTLETLTRDEAKEKIRSLGGDVSESVSKATDFMVAGSEPGSKYGWAKKLGVKIVGEKDFLKMLSR